VARYFVAGGPGGHPLSKNFEGVIAPR